MQKKLDVLQSLFSNRSDSCCLVETWLTEQFATVDVPGYTRHSVFWFVTQRGPIRGGIYVFVAEVFYGMLHGWACV